MSRSHVWRAWVNCGELVSMLAGITGRWALPPEKVGSGKLVMPCARMQAAALR